MHPDLKLHLRSLTRLTYVVTDEEDRVIKDIIRALPTRVPAKGAEGRGPPPTNIKVYNSALGLIPASQLVAEWSTRALGRTDDYRDAVKAMETIYSEDTRERLHYYIITDPERYLQENDFVRRILNILHQLQADFKVIKCLIFVGSRLVIPAKLSSYMHVVRDTHLDEQEVGTILDGLSPNVRKRLPEGARTWFQGLTSYQINSALAQAIIRTKGHPDPAIRGTITRACINDYKRERIKKTDLLSLVDTAEFSFDVVGGVDRFKAWANETRHAWTPEGKAFGLKPPKGVLCVGAWGCGKSLAVKALGAAWGLPMVQLELGRLRNSGVGNTEDNTYRVIGYLEAMAPCVTGDTMVTLADGSARPIEELWKEWPKDLRVMCWNEKTLRISTTVVKGITRRVAEAFRVSTANGFSVCATENHQHYVLRGAMPEWIRTDELMPGDMLAVPLRKYDGESDCGRFHPEGMRSYQREDGEVEFRRGGGGFRDARVSTLPTSWTTELGWLLGALEGDGYIALRGTIGMTNCSVDLLEAFSATLQEFFGLVPSCFECTSDGTVNLPGLSPDPEFKPCWHSKVGNQLAAEFLRAARASILTAPPRVRAAFLAGWVDADGCIGPDKLSVTVRGPRRRRERRLLVRQVVQSLGVVPSKFNTNTCEITGSRAAPLAALLEEHLVIKQMKAHNVRSSSIQGFDRGMGFACGRLLQEARHNSGLTWAMTKLPYGTTWTYEKGRVPISERHMRTYIDKFGVHAGKLKRIQEAECRWVALKEVSPLGEAVVYDLVCDGEDTHSFFANGLITHNCIAWVDEADKSFSGAQSSSYSDAGTTSRTLGILSTWHQETTAEVCLALTANSLKTLPVEFTNRISERFFFDLPSEDDRIEILKIQLKKFGNLTAEQISEWNLRSLAETADGMVPREMEQAVDAALRKSFHQKKPRLDFDIFEQELRTKPRILKTMDAELKEVLDWVGYDETSRDGLRARYASTKQSKNTLQILKGGIE